MNLCMNEDFCCWMRRWEQSWLEHFKCRITGILASHPTCEGSVLFGRSQLVTEMLFRQGNVKSDLGLFF